MSRRAGGRRGPTTNPAILWAKANTPEGCCICCDRPVRKLGSVQPLYHRRDPECRATFWELWESGRRELREEAEPCLSDSTHPEGGDDAR